MIWLIGPTPAPLAAPLLADLLGVGFCHGLALGRIGRGRGGKIGLPVLLGKTQLHHARREMIGQRGGNVDLVALGMIDPQAPRVEVHLAADAAGQERGLPAIFAIADDRVADRRHMDTQLVGATGQRLKLDPGGAVAGLIDDAIAGARGLAAFPFLDHHLLAPAARLFGQRQFDQPVGDVGHANHQRPVQLARGAAREMLGKERRATRRARDQEDARGVLVEPVDEARAGGTFARKGIEQAVDVVRDAAAALRCEAGRLVEDDRGAVLFYDHRLGLGDLFGAERRADGRGTRRRQCGRTGRYPQGLAGGQPVGGIGPCPIDPDLPSPRPAADRGEADVGQIALEPAVEPDAPVVLRDDKMSNVVRPNGELADVRGSVTAGTFGLGHAAIRIAISPM